MVKLIRITTNKRDGTFDTDFRSPVNVKENSKIALQNLIKVGSLTPISFEACAVVSSIIALGLFNIYSATFTSDFLNLGRAILISLNNLVCIKVRIGFLD